MQPTNLRTPAGPDHPKPLAPPHDNDKSFALLQTSEVDLRKLPGPAHMS